MANTSPIPIIAQAPYRRATPVRHRRLVATWAAEHLLRRAQAWLAHPVEATRARHATIACLYGTVAVASAAILTAVAR